MKNPLYRSKSYFSGRNLAKFRQEKKKRKTLDSDGANERPKFTQNNNWVLKREREREREREIVVERERDCVFSSIAVFD
jgi:hypothetical protein